MASSGMRRPEIGLTERGRLVLAAVAVLVLVVVVVLVARALGGGSDKAPPNAAAKLIPANALVYVHLSTDRHRSATEKAAQLVERFPSWPALRDRVVKGLSAPGCHVGDDALRKAKEVALGLFDVAGGRTANSLVLVDTGKDHGNAEQRGCGALSIAYVGRFLAIGQPESIQLAQKLQKGQGQSLADAPGPKSMFAQLPAARVADGWVSQDGVRRLLAPQGGILGAVGTLVDQPALKGAAFGLEATDTGAKLVVRSVLDPQVAKQRSSGFRAFHPTLQSQVPASTMTYLGVSNLAPALQRLIGATGSTPQIGSLVQGLDPKLLRLFQGEAAIVLLPAAPAPVLVLVARTDDEAASRRALAQLPAQLRKAFSTAVFDGKVVLSTKPEGVRAMRAGGDRLADTDAWRQSVGKGPDQASALVFLDFNRLLSLGEQTGLDQSSAYQAAKGDLEKVRAIGARTSGNDHESTAEISLLIP